MDVLNTYGGGVNEGVAIFAAFLVIGALVLFALSYVFLLDEDWTNSALAAISGIVVAGIAVLLITSCGKQPVRHEVTLRPGHVIDATKYEIVEQRGQIYVIEEKEGAN